MVVATLPPRTHHLMTRTSPITRTHIHPLHTNSYFFEDFIELLTWNADAASSSIRLQKYQTTILYSERDRITSPERRLRDTPGRQKNKTTGFVHQWEAAFTSDDGFNGHSISSPKYSLSMRMFSSVPLCLPLSARLESDAVTDLTAAVTFV
ncbi:hypothetical protein J6590_104059 [Homalodisca vitripennis]|nr:hypothetical protein J6590_104059 [Homalodisca vitripennis]